jgi:oligosaccharide repeat unit polymerase
MAVGACFYIIGMALGWKQGLLRVKKFTREVLSKNLRSEKKIDILFVISLISVPLSFVIVGFVPAFAQNPLDAKFLRSTYHINPFLDFIYRSIFAILPVIIIPIAYKFVKSQSPRYFVMSVIVILYLFLYLQRGYIGIGALVVLAFLSYNSPLRFALFFILNLLFFIVGTIFYEILDYLGFLHTSFGDLASTLYSKIALGAPDVSDQVNVLQHFLNNGSPYTYGLTFFGGLIPLHFKWNPAVWSLDTINGLGSLNSTTSGGIVFTPALMGYVSFGWAGVMFVCLFSGYLQGRFTKWMRNKFTDAPDMMIVIYSYLFYTIVLQFFANFYAMYLTEIPQILVVIFMLYRIRLVRSEAKTAPNSRRIFQL